MQRCQEAGIIAAVVQSAEGPGRSTIPSSSIATCNPVVNHPEIGEFEYEGYPVKLSRTRPSCNGRGPLLRSTTANV